MDLTKSILDMFTTWPNDVQQGAVNILMDSIINSKIIRSLYAVSMVTDNLAKTTQLNGHYHQVSDTTSLIAKMIINPTSTTASLFSESAVLSTYEKAMALPNVGGIPIVTDTSMAERTVDVSELLLINEESATQEYWTDNAVPRPQTFTLTGYLTSMTAIVDQGFILKPTLDTQTTFLDLCAKSRRPVLFKTSRGKFLLAQITNLQTTEEASYNNAIKINISLKEYNPYVVKTGSTFIIPATTDEGAVLSQLGGA